MAVVVIWDPRELTREIQAFIPEARAEATGTEGRLSVGGLDLDFDAEVHVGLRFGGPGRGLDCKKVVITQRPGGPEVTSEGLRAIPVGAIMRMFSTWLADQLREAAGALEFLDSAALGPVDSNIRYVADVYRKAEATGLPPTKRVMELTGLPRATASRWLRKARDLGYLDEPAPRRQTRVHIESVPMPDPPDPRRAT